MDSTIIVALITGLAVAVPTIISTFVTGSAHDKIVDERMKNLTDKVDSLSEKVAIHNNMVEKVALLEHDLQTSWKRIDELREALNSLRKD